MALKGITCFRPFDANMLLGPPIFENDFVKEQRHHFVSYQVQLYPWDCFD